MPIEIVELEGGLYVVRGRLDEHFDYGPLEAAVAPVRINLRAVDGANSLGVRRYLAFMMRSGARRLEFHECSLGFMDMVNTFPGCLGSPQDPALIKSIVLLYRCLACLKDEEVLMAVPPIGAVVPELPLKACGRCRSVLMSLADRDDLFTYLLAGD